MTAIRNEQPLLETPTTPGCSDNDGVALHNEVRITRLTTALEVSKGKVTRSQQYPLTAL